MKVKNKKDSLLHHVKKEWKLYSFMLIPILYYIIFKYIPVFGNLIAFRRYRGGPNIFGDYWVGFRYFEQFLSDPEFWQAFWNTLRLSIGYLLVRFPATLIFALLLNEIRRKHWKKTVQTISYLPHFISWVVLASIVQTILSPSSGVVNYIIQLLGGEPIFFMGSSDWFRKVIVGSSIWRDTGWQTVVFMAAILSIDPQLYEAADLDGAGRFQKMIYVTLPCIAPTIIIMFIMATGNVIQDDFDQIYNMLNAKVMDVGDVIGTYTYRMGIEKMNFSYATAVGLFKNVVSLILVTFTNAFSRKLSGSSLW